MKKLTAIIPARSGSKRFPDKNIVLLGHTLEFIKSSGLFEKCIVTSDIDSIVHTVEQEYGFVYDHRPVHLCGDTTAIKPVVQDVVSKYGLYDSNLALMYLTFPDRTYEDYVNAYDFFVNRNLKSLMSFYKSEDSPYLMFYNDPGELSPLIQHSLYRHQDYRDVLSMMHYVCFFRGDIVHALNDQLYCCYLTKPFMLHKRPVDIDYKEQYIKWMTARGSS